MAAKTTAHRNATVTPAAPVIFPGEVRVPARLWLSDQSWHWQGVFRLCDRAVRVTIRRNAYDDQSYARAEVWSPTMDRWSEVASLPIGLCACRVVSYVQREVPEGAFDADVRALLREAAAVLSVAR